jgi:hypothetical protein
MPPLQDGEPPMSAAELHDLEERVSEYDRQLFALVDEDVANLLQHVRHGEARISKVIATLQSDAMELSILIDEPRLRQLQEKLPGAPDNLQSLCRHVFALRVSHNPPEMAKLLQDFGKKFNVLVDLMNAHTQYMEINVAGFRKLLKRHEKQIPAQFHARQMPHLGFHKLVTRTSRQLLDVCRQLQQIQTNAWQQVVASTSFEDNDASALVTAATSATNADARELKGLGLECDMVVRIQKQLKEPFNKLAPTAALDSDVHGRPPDCSYPKPECSQAVAGDMLTQCWSTPTSADMAVAGPCGAMADPYYMDWRSAHASVNAATGICHVFQAEPYSPGFAAECNT